MSSSSSSQQRNPDLVEQDRMLEETKDLQSHPLPDSVCHQEDTMLVCDTINTSTKALTFSTTLTSIPVEQTTATFLQAMGASEVLMQFGDTEPYYGNDIITHVQVLLRSLRPAHRLQDLFRSDVLVVYHNCNDEEVIFHLMQSVPLTQLMGDVHQHQNRWVSFKSEHKQQQSTREFKKFFASDELEVYPYRVSLFVC